MKVLKELTLSREETENLLKAALQNLVTTVLSGYTEDEVMNISLPTLYGRSKVTIETKEVTEETQEQKEIK